MDDKKIIVELFNPVPDAELFAMITIKFWRLLKIGKLLRYSLYEDYICDKVNWIKMKIGLPDL